MARHTQRWVFIRIETGQVFYAGVTANPTGAWTTQAACNLFLGHADQLAHAKAPVSDRVSQFVDVFDEVYRTEGFKVVTPPVHTPVANSSTAPSSATTANSNTSSSTASLSTAATGHTAPSTSGRRGPPRTLQTVLRQPSRRSERPDATPPSTNTKMQPD